jgi:hypothetical protein
VVIDAILTAKAAAMDRLSTHRCRALSRWPFGHVSRAVFGFTMSETWPNGQRAGKTGRRKSTSRKIRCLNKRMPHVFSASERDHGRTRKQRLLPDPRLLAPRINHPKKLQA